MSFNDEILTGIDEIKDELDEIISCLKRLQQRVVRIEASQQSRNDSALFKHVPLEQKVAEFASRLTDKDSIESLIVNAILNEQPQAKQELAELASRARACTHQAQQSQDPILAELSGEPDISRLHVREDTSTSKQHQYITAESDPPAPPPPSDASPMATRLEYTSLQLHPSLRGGWGDEEAEEILYEKLATAYCPSGIRRYLGPLEKQLAALKKQLPSVIQLGLTSAAREHTQPAECEARQAPVSTSGEPTSSRSYSKARCITANTRMPSGTPKTTRPVFGLPSTPSRRIVSSFDISSSPFAMYSHEHSPFLQLAKKRGSASRV